MYREMATAAKSLRWMSSLKDFGQEPCLVICRHTNTKHTSKHCYTEPWLLSPICKWRYRQVVKSSPFHGEVLGSNPSSVTILFNSGRPAAEECQGCRSVFSCVSMLTKKTGVCINGMRGVRPCRCDDSHGTDPGRRIILCRFLVGDVVRLRVCFFGF